jgi:hypothetical protein
MISLADYPASLWEGKGQSSRLLGLQKLSADSAFINIPGCADLMIKVLSPSLLAVVV